MAWAIAVVLAAPAAAHEFWIDAEAWQVAPGENLKAALRVGEKMEGGSYAYIPPDFTRFEIAMGDAIFPVEGRAGDRPALNMAIPGEGLAVVAHVTKDYRLTYTEWQKFVDFCEHKDFAWAIDRHRARGLPETGFRELYSRHGKSLIGVGAAQGQDRALGLLTEVVANANPYTDDLSAGFPVTVLFDGAPRVDTQVELFEKAPDGTVAVTLHRTDGDGRAVLPVRPGHVYLVDAVVMRPLEPAEDGDPVWESLWASLTFAVPQ
ncbi:DUF4198 domain-containing protein [Thalassococcus sp. CAU 1522]|uniref:DUF4198 domain-containing protein n=2 Tax=Thalassococcus arenae TaxID=2851652 RepID=A0ABS6N3T6_9RHOB|nr:DUF4198 domain-containing protein [Thalassococcus arenae]